MKFAPGIVFQSDFLHEGILGPMCKVAFIFRSKGESAQPQQSTRSILFALETISAAAGKKKNHLSVEKQRRNMVNKNTRLEDPYT